MKTDERFTAAGRFMLYASMITVFVITMTRAAVTNITDDEAYTYLMYVHHIDFFRFDTLRALFTGSLANNHWLNTLLINLCERLFHTSYNEFIVRLPSLLFFALYLAGTGIGYETKRVSLPAAFLLCGNYYLNEFYGLGRGYGMANTLMLFACLFYVTWRESAYENHRMLTGCAAMLLLAVFANTITLMALPAFGILWLTRLVRTGGFKSYIRKYGWFAVLFFAGAVLMAVYHMNVSAESKPLYTGEGGFVRMTLLAYFRMFATDRMMVLVLAACAGFAVLYAVWRLKRGILACDFVLICLIFALTCVGMELVLHKGYMTGRVTLPFYALVVAASDELYREVCRKMTGAGTSVWVPRAVCVAVFLACLVSHVTQFNVLATREWATDYGRRERVTEQFMETGGEIPAVEEPFDYTNVFYYEKISGEEFRR